MYERMIDICLYASTGDGRMSEDDRALVVEFRD